LGLAAFYIVPAAFEQRWVQIGRAIIPGMRVEDSFLFAHTADAFHDQVLRTASWIFILELAAAAIAAYLAWRKQAGGAARISLTAMLPVILLLQLPVSDVIWKYAPHMKFLQFPWRWLMGLSVVASVLAGMGMKPGRRSTIIAGVILPAMTIGGALLFFQPCDDEDAVSAQVANFLTGQGVAGTDEYTPVGADNSAVQQHLPLVRVVRGAQDDTADSTPADNPEWRPGSPGSIGAGVVARRQNEEHWILHVVTPEPGYAVLRLMDYPSWQVTVDGELALLRPVREDGLMAVPVKAGGHAIDVRWTATSDVVAGRQVSAVALLLLAGVVMLERKMHQDGRV
jgi:hypothetical protein